MAKESTIARESTVNPINAVRGGYLGVSNRTLREGKSSMYTQERAISGIIERSTRLMKQAVEQGANTERVRKAFRNLMNGIGQ